MENFWPFFFTAIGIFIFKGGTIEYYNQVFLLSCLFIGMFYGFALITIAYAFTLGDTSMVSPFQYVQLIFAISLGYILFGDAPDTLKITGAFITAGSGIFFFQRIKSVKKA